MRWTVPRTDTVLGTLLGETACYTLTALWTVLVVATLRTPRWFALLGYVSAAAIAIDVLVPLGVEPAGFTNFLGYLLWSAWLFAFAALLARHGAMPSRVASQGS